MASKLVIGYVLQLGLRLLLCIGRDGPTNFADETGYLVNARVLAGGLPGTLDDAAFYRGGYSLLLVPARLLGTSPLSEYRLALATNAVLSSLVFLLLYAVLRRVFDTAPRPAVAAAFVAALYPPLVVTTQFAWTESLLPVLVLAAVLGLAQSVTASSRRAAIGWAVATGASGGAMYTVHGRTAPVVLLLAGLLMACAVIRWVDVAAAAAGLAALATVGAGGAALNGWLLDRSWGGRADGDAQRVFDNARDLSSLPNVGALAAGQYWYVAVATFGLLGLGIAAAAPYLRAGRSSNGARVAVAFVLVSCLSLVVLVGLFLRPPFRPDHVVYGRYVEIVVPLLLALGLLRLWHAPARRTAAEMAATLGLAALATAAFVPYAHHLVTRSPVNWYTVLALPAMAQRKAAINPATALLAAALGAVVLLVVTKRSPRLGALGLALAFAASSLALRVVLIEERDRVTYGSRPSPIQQIDGLPTADIGYDLAAYTPIGLYGYQWQLDRARFVLFDSRREPPPETWVISGLQWPAGQRLGARRVWAQEEIGQAVWRLPTSGVTAR